MISSEGSSSDLGKNVSDFKERVFEIIEELTHDIDSCSEEISKQAIEHIHASEIILTIGRSRTVERFLKNAAKTCKFEVIVAEAAADFSGHQMASNLAKAKISTTIIKDSAIFAVMARIDNVISIVSIPSLTAFPPALLPSTSQTYLDIPQAMFTDKWETCITIKTEIKFLTTFGLILLNLHYEIHLLSL